MQTASPPSKPSNYDTTNRPVSRSIAGRHVRLTSDISVQDCTLNSTVPPEGQDPRIGSAEEGISSHNETSQNSDHGIYAPMATQSTGIGMQRLPTLLPKVLSVGCAVPFDADEATNGASPDPPPSEREKVKAVRWRDLPRKGQLAILTLARLSEPLTQTSLQSYMFYQLRSFDPSLQDSAISSQIGILQGCFTFAQFMTAVIWGRVSDAQWGGRKRVLLIGLLGTGISSVGFGFSRSFAWAVFWRTLGGALNGNVGVMRTMISEIIKEKRFQSRAFLLLPMCFNIGICPSKIRHAFGLPFFRRHHWASPWWSARRSCGKLS